MSKELKLLYVEDDKDNRNDLVKILQDETLDDFKIIIEAIDTFESAIKKIESSQYHIVILDIFKGNPRDNGEKAGLQVLQQIQNKCFLPVIFYSGNTKDVRELRSQIVGVVTKGDGGFDELKEEIKRLVKFNLPFIKEKVHHYLENEFKDYFWSIIHEERDKFKPDNKDFSLGYLMLRKFGTSLSKEKISEILGDVTLNDKKVHPMEFYIYPTDVEQEYECGEILEKEDNIYVILTPSCDFAERFNKKGERIDRKAGKVLLAKTVLLASTDEYISYLSSRNTENKNKLERLITAGKGDRYFFLPETPFIKNSVIDFQNKEMVEYSELRNFKRLAKLDSPFSEGMIASFIRYYNRVGYPDIDSDLIIKHLDTEQNKQMAVAPRES